MNSTLNDSEGLHFLILILIVIFCSTIGSTQVLRCVAQRHFLSIYQTNCPLHLLQLLLELSHQLSYHFDDLRPRRDLCRCYDCEYSGERRRRPWKRSVISLDALEGASPNVVISSPAWRVSTSFVRWCSTLLVVQLSDYFVVFYLPPFIIGGVGSWRVWSS
jgi:hypothetical protein